MKPTKPLCKICDSPYHFQSFCFSKQKKRIKIKKDKLGKIKLSEKQLADRAFKNQWTQDNPPDKYGNWLCYLQIAPNCLKRLTIYTLTLEHVVPKSRGVKYRHNKDNVKPACFFCNSLKGSRTIEALAKEYPQLKSIVKKLTL